MVRITYHVTTLVAFPGLVENPRKPFFTLSTSLSLSALEICEDNHSLRYSVVQMWNLTTGAKPNVTIRSTLSYMSESVVINTV